VPTYDYVCQACNHRFEKLQSMTARPLRKCPECGAAALERLIGPGAGFLFKGNGFYATDYRSQSYQDGKKAAEPAKSEKGDAPAAKPAAEPKKNAKD
jgi:putative FmdB family regulatory protein